MSVFMLDTDSVSSVSSSLSSIASQVDNIASAVSGYDTSCDDFDFSTPKSIIANNISACGIKIQNTISVIESVVSSHTTLQNSLKFGAASAREKQENIEKARYNSASRSSGATYGSNGGSRSTSGYSTSYMAASAVPTATSFSNANSNSFLNGDANTGKISTAGAGAKPISELAMQLNGVVVESRFKNVSYSTIDTNVGASILSLAIRNIIDNEDFKYSEVGFATIGGMYVISCSKAFGTVGEKIEFTLKDGTKIECIIGENTEDEEIHFFVKEGFDEEENALSEDFLANIIEIKNYGDSNYYVYGEKVKSAIDWALATASDDSHGYSQQSRWGSPSYDCSSFVISAFESAGISVKNAGAGYTGNMKSAFTKSGFVWIPGDPKIEDLQPGDILLNEGKHTEMYIGYGLMVGAHGNYDGTGSDPSGKEISVCTFRSFPWNGILRYVGNNEDEGDENDANIYL